MEERKNFAKLKEVIEPPYLLDLQTVSFASFLQQNIAAKRRKDQGLQAVFKEIFPIESENGEHKLEFVSYSVDRPKYDLEECRRRGMTYASALKVKLRLRSKKDVKEQDVYFADIPLMTPTGTFIVNGDERVIVSQLHRSPGISFEEEVQLNGKKTYSVRLIPYRGAWLEFGFDQNNIIHVYIDRKRKALVTTFLRTMGYSSDNDILKEFCGIEKVKCENKTDLKPYLDRVIAEDIVHPQSQQLIAKRFEKIESDLIEKIIV